MDVKLIPSKEIVEHLRPKPTVSNIIYLLSVGLIIVCIVLLPYIYVDVSIKCSGLLRPAFETSTIKIPSSGKISQVFVSLNQQVLKGQKILSLDSAIIEQKTSFLTQEINEDKLMVEDLKILLSGDYSLSNITTSFYKQTLLSYLQKKRELSNTYNKSKMDYSRNLKLHKAEVIADTEFENFQFELEKAKNELELHKETSLTQWETELLQYEQEIAEHETQLNQYKEEKQNLTVRAPITGTIQNLNSIYPESQVFANQDIAQISPDTNLIAEAYINPSDIGLLKINMPVRFQVDAFNYNQWGLATGKVVEISSDVHTINETSVFKVRCMVDQEYLQLKDGYKGYLKKGMTLQARFMVTERTLWQLLFDKVDDWLNPDTYVK